MCDAVRILERIVTAEEAGLAHAEACDICHYGARLCQTGQDLAVDCITNLLEAKVFVERQPKPEPLQIVSVSA